MPRSTASPDPLVSVVIAAHNARRYVRATVESVLQQTLIDLELVVVDDGSDDGTADIVASIGDPRVRVVTQDNSGPAAARNVGMREARSRAYVAVLDADDLWDPDKLRRQLEYLTHHPDCSMCGCFMRYISSNGDVLGRTGQAVNGQEQALVAAGELFPFPLSTFLVRRRAIDRANGFDEALGRPSGGAEDIDWLARLARAGRIGCVPEVLGSYRIHPASAMARDRRRINREARFVRRRLAARREGGDLTWEAFAAADRSSWRDRRQDYVELCYRSAALGYGEHHRVRAAMYAIAATLIDPRYTLRRVYRQRFRRAVSPPPELAS